MTLPGSADVYALIDATWPAARTDRVGPWLVRDGRGGGSRVSAATMVGAPALGDLELAEHAMAALGQAPLFMIRDGDADVDRLLADAGYAVKDPVVAYAASLDVLIGDGLPRLSAFRAWPPLAVQAEIWATADIGPARLAVMDRALGPKTSFLGRRQDCPAGTVYVACHGTHAMLHALEVLSKFRRQGLARHLVRAAAIWAQAQGAVDLSLVVTRANVAANALYASLGMEVVGQYHYRIRPQ